jgi:hypothetical protein
MRLEVVIQASELSILLHNDGSDALRIWDFNNSWGWRTLTLVFKKKGSDEQLLLTQRKIMGWTVNFPSFTEIRPHEKYVLPLDPSDGSWESDQNLADLKVHPLLVKAVLEIPETPEAKEFGVFVGKVESDWVRSEPPHRWLFQKD